MSSKKVWFESYWWSPPLSKYGAPYDRWMMNKTHKTLNDAEKECLAAQKNQPYIHYCIREVTCVLDLPGK